MLYFNLYRTPKGLFYVGGLFDSEDDARKYASTDDGTYVKTCSVSKETELAVAA